MQPYEGEITVRIYSYPQHGRWYAEALSLALRAEGDSEREAIDSLVGQVMAYVRTAITRGWYDQLNRPASLAHRLEVSARVRWAKMRPGHNGMVRNQLVRI